MGGTLTPGDRAAWWIGNLTLTDDFAGRPFDLRPWQADDIIRPLFGTLRPDGLRQYRRCFLFLPRKQAKTQLSAGIGTFALLGEKDASGRPKEGQEIVCAASDREQASHLFNKVLAMIDADRTLAHLVRVYHSVKRIVAKKGGNVLRVVSSEGRRQHGGNPSLVLFDELHAQPDRRLYDALTSGQATRTERLILLITTAGNNRNSLCHEQYQYACRVRDGKVDDPSYLPIIYEAAREDDWTDEATWRKAMPAFGDFADPDYFREEFAKAKEIPSEESKFRQYYLNQWVASATKWLNSDAWDRCGRLPFDPETLRDRPCYAGIDMSSTSDITAVVLVFPMDGENYHVLPFFWVPEDAARKRDAKGETSYGRWADRGFITLTDGDSIDHHAIFDRIVGRPDDHPNGPVVGLIEDYQVEQFLVDPFNATWIASKLQAEGLPVEMMRQGTYSMNGPTKLLEALIAQEKIHHGDNPVLNWMADNAVAERDGEGNVKLSKGKSADKIDGMPCLIMGLAGANRTPPVEAGVVYRN